MTDANSAAEVLEIKGLTKSLGGRNILCDINLSVNSGEVFGFLGPNGSGKTTTIKLILGLLNIQKGEIKICGYDVRRDFEKAMRNVGGIIENPRCTSISPDARISCSIRECMMMFLPNVLRRL